MKTLLAIDGNSILNRAYYGLRPLTTKSGLFTHAVFGMINIIDSQIKAVSPDMIAAAFLDHGGHGTLDGGSAGDEHHVAGAGVFGEDTSIETFQRAKTIAQST